MAEPWEVWNQIIEKASSRGVADLNDFEENIYRVNIFLCDMDNGGLTGFLYNVSPSSTATTEWSDLRQTAKAIKIMGVSACADALFQAASCFESVSNAENTWRNLLEDPKLAELIKAIEQPVKEAIPELWEKLEDFTLQKMPV